MPDINTVLSQLQTALTTAQSIAASPPPGTLPAWLNGKPLLTWIPIPKSSLGISDSPAMIAELAATGLCNADGTNNGNGRMPAGICEYSGGTVRPSTSELFITGGGGAGAWRGNDVRVLKLSDDAPAWQVAVPSNPPAQLATTGSTEYLPDGKNHNAGHALWSLHFLDSQNKLLHVTNTSTWPADAGMFAGVDSVDFSVARLSRKWDPAGTNPRFLVEGLGQQYLWQCKDPATEIIYVGSSSGVYKRDPVLGTFALMSQSTGDGAAAIGLGIILNMEHNGYPATNSIDLVTGLATRVTISGMPTIITVRAAGLVFDPGLGAFVFFQDDGKLYKIARTDATHFACSDLGVAGTIITAGTHQTYGRMQHVPNLKGIAIMPDGVSPVVFVRTA